MSRRRGRLASASIAVAGLCYVQLLVGAHVTGINAGLAFRDFPLMDGALVPAIGSQRELFHATHRFLALALATAVVLLVVRARRERAARLAAGTWGARERWLVRLPQAALALVGVQVVLGVANLYNGTSWVTVVPHLAVGSWIWTVLVFQSLLAAGDAAPVRGHAPGVTREEVPA